MKKTLFVFLVILVLIGVFSVPALAENVEIDLSDLNLEELIDLYNQIRVELSNRIGIEYDSFIGRGEFVVGVDIKAGFYDLECVESVYDHYHPEETDNGVFVSDSENNCYFSSRHISVGGHVNVRLNETDVLEVYNCTFKITPVQASWAP